MKEVVQTLNKAQVEHLRAAFVSAVQSIRQGFQAADVRNFNVQLKASGRSFGGEAKVEAVVSTCEYGGKSVTANDLLDAYHEALRREGFDVTHKPLTLPAPGGTEEEDLQDDL